MDKTEGSTSSLSMMTTSGSLAPAVSSVSPLSPAVSLGSQVKSQSTLSHLLQQQNGNINMSPSTLREDVSVTDDTSSTGNKDDDDDEDEEDGNDENFDGLNRDPERLKAFNMFVRLFVDENLDRHVPISKQPKEKIQAIIDSCTRQFPEYSERARKRIRTYLKSCRRTKRSREQAGLDINNRPTPPHLTSVLAEQLLARACENEAENAKRMRMGLEPVSQSLPSSLMTSPSMDTMPSPPQLSLTTSAKIDYKSEQLVNLLSAAQNAAAAPPPPPAPAHISLSGSNNSHISGSNGAGLTQSPQFLGVSSVGLLDGMGLANGQNSVEGLKKAPILNHKLNGTEIAAVRQLITGYRESAAFLLRSADELEHLIQIQAKL